MQDPRRNEIFVINRAAKAITDTRDFCGCAAFQADRSGKSNLPDQQSVEPAAHPVNFFLSNNQKMEMGIHCEYFRSSKLTHLA
jgi:hypothetical protein